MNDTFDIKRFGLLLKKTLLERPVQLAGLTGLTLIFLLLMYAVCRYLINWDVAQNGSFMLGFVGGGSFLASFVINYFSSNASGSSYLTLPASHFEKWLCAILISGILFTIIFLVFYRIIDTTFVALYHRGLDPKGPFYKEMYEAVNTFPYDGFVALQTYKMYLNFAGAMLIGTLYFNKGAFIKVALIICGLFIGTYFLNGFMAKMLFDSVDRALPFNGVFISVGKEFGKIELPSYASKAVNICILYIVPAILWVGAYVRLREKEF